MDALKQKIIRFPQSAKLPPMSKWMFSKNFLFKSSLLLNSKCIIQVRPLNNSDDLLPSIPSLSFFYALYIQYTYYVTSNINIDSAPAANNDVLIFQSAPGPGTIY